MKRIMYFFVFLLSLSASAFAGGIQQMTNQSAEYIKTLNRNASVELDAMFYNPAGTAMMQDGLYIYLSNQTLIAPVTVEDNMLGDYEGLKLAPIFPSLFLQYNIKDFAVSGGFYFGGGGGGGTFDKGLPALAGLGNTSIEAAAVDYAVQLNVAYAFLDKKISIGAGYRLLIADNSFELKFRSITLPPALGGITLPGGKHVLTQSGISHGIIGSICVAPIKDLNIAFKYEWHSEFKVKNDVSTNYAPFAMNFGMMADKAESFITLPMTVSGGISYKISGVKLEFDFTGYLNQLAYWNGAEEYYKLGYDTGLGIDYTFSAIPLNIGCGYMYTESGAEDEGQSQLKENLDSHNIGIGLTYSLVTEKKVFNKVDFTLSYMFMYCVPENVNAGSALLPSKATYNQIGHIIALGIQMKVL